MKQLYKYVGKELLLFNDAANWKRYVASQIRPYIRGDVAEVGAGIGGFTTYLYNSDVTSWIYIEPDKDYSLLLNKKVEERSLPKGNIVNGRLETVSGKMMFDTILYIDVMEHIKDDKSEFLQAIASLKKGGHIIVLSPSFQCLYSPFDKAIGHYRRYTKKTLQQMASADNIKVQKLFYMDTAGIILSIANKYLLKKEYPSQRDIRIWQDIFIPISKLLDKMTLYKIGKSVVGIWQKL